MVVQRVEVRIFIEEIALVVWLWIMVVLRLLQLRNGLVRTMMRMNILSVNGVRGLVTLMGTRAMGFVSVLLCRRGCYKGKVVEMSKKDRLIESIYMTLVCEMQNNSNLNWICCEDWRLARIEDVKLLRFYLESKGVEPVVWGDDADEVYMLLAMMEDGSPHELPCSDQWGEYAALRRILVNLGVTGGVLRLNLKRKWWEQIRDGVKSRELRLFNDFWKKRLVGRDYDEVHLCLGYPKKGDDDKVLKRKFGGCELVSIVHQEFGADEVVVFSIDVSEAV